MSNAIVTEDELKAKAVAPRVTMDAINASIMSEHYFRGDEVGQSGKYNPDWEIPKSIEALSLLTFCILVLKNGFTVVGKSACASPENYNKDIGERIARENAVREIWPLMGYALKNELAAQKETQGNDSFITRMKIEAHELDDKLAKLGSFIDGKVAFARLPGNERQLLIEQHKAMTDYSKILNDRIKVYS